MRLLLKRNCLTARDLLCQELRASDKERKIIEAEGGKGQGGDTACLRSFLIKRELQLFIQRQAVGSEKPGKEGEAEKILEGSSIHCADQTPAWEELPQNVELSWVSSSQHLSLLL